MTCILGLEYKGRVYIGADSAGVSGMDLQVRADPKVFTVGELLIGITSSFRMGNLLRFKFKPDPKRESMDDFEYLSTTCVDHMRAVFRSGGFLKREEEREEGGQMLIAYKSRLYYVDSDFQVGRNLDPISAVGCGAHVALGALAAFLTLDSMNPEQMVHSALKVSERWSAGVRAPFLILSQGD